MQIVMGIDPGAANLGFGLVRVEGNRMVALDGGVVETSPDLPIEEDTAGKLMRLIDALEDNDDVNEVHANFDVDASVLERVAG